MQTPTAETAIEFFAHRAQEHRLHFRKNNYDERTISFLVVLMRRETKRIDTRTRKYAATRKRSTYARTHACEGCGWTPLSTRCEQPCGEAATVFSLYEKLLCIPNVRTSRSRTPPVSVSIALAVLQPHRLVLSLSPSLFLLAFCPSLSSSFSHSLCPYASSFSSLYQRPYLLLPLFHVK